jgi:hypothetical protein
MRGFARLAAESGELQASRALQEGLEVGGAEPHVACRALRVGTILP